MAKNVYLIGNGSLGSFAALILGRFAGQFDWKLTFIDYDKVEEYNLQNQFFRREDIGLVKSVALANLLRELQETQADATAGKADSGSFFRGAVIVLVDNMESRRAIFSACRYRVPVDYYVEARSGGDAALVYGLDPRDPDCVRRYGDCLYDDADALPAPCANPRQIPIIFLVAAAVAELLARNSERRDAPNEFVRVMIGYDENDLPIVRSAAYTDVSY